jgi:hypothetical protein
LAAADGLVCRQYVVVRVLGMAGREVVYCLLPYGVELARRLDPLARSAAHRAALTAHLAESGGARAVCSGRVLTAMSPPFTDQRFMVGADMGRDVARTVRA